MPGGCTHIYKTIHLSLNSTLLPWPRIKWTLQREKGKESNGPVHGPPLQARVAAANGTVFAACKLVAQQTAGPDKLLALTDDPGAHG